MNYHSLQTFVGASQQKNVEFVSKLKETVKETYVRPFCKLKSSL